MPLRSDWSNRPCTIARGIEALGDPWVLLVLREAFSGVRRFEDFARHTEANDKILASRLKYLVDEGLLERRPLSDGQRPRAEYLLTESGADALPILHAYAQWADKHASAPTKARLNITCGACGATARSADSCLDCGERLAPGNVVWERPGEWAGIAIEVVGAGVHTD